MFYCRPSDQRLRLPHLDRAAGALTVARHQAREVHASHLAWQLRPGHPIWPGLFIAASYAPTQQFHLLGLRVKIRSLRKFVVAPKTHIGHFRPQLAQ
jgi:hypothetical protein